MSRVRTTLQPSSAIWSWGAADVFGFSMGGGIAMQVAIRHPALVRKLVVVSAPCRSDGEYPEIRALMASFEPESPILAPMRDAYMRVAPNPGDWPRLIAKGRELMADELDWSKDVAAMRAPTLIVVGDSDIVLPSHAVEMFGLLGGARADAAMGRPFPSQLAIVPGTTHFSILSRVDLLLAAICPFLDGPAPPDA